MSVAWIEASRTPKVPGTNAHASAFTPIIFLIAKISWFTLGIVMAVVVCIAYLSIKGREVTWLVRKGKSSLRGGKVSARPFYYRRRALRVQSHSDCEMSALRKVG